MSTSPSLEAFFANELSWHTIVSIMAEGVVAHDTSGRIFAFNPSALRILGLSADELRGRTSVDPRWHAIHEDGSPFPGESHPAMVTLRTGEPCSNVVMGIMKPSGERTWISINSQPLIHPGEDKPWGVVVSFSDITELIAVEQRARAAVEQASAAKDQFLATLSHELRTPLSAILMRAQMLSRGHADEEKLRAGIKKIEQSAWVQKRIIDDLLDVSRMIAGKLDLESYPIDPRMVLQVALDSVRPAADAKSIHIEQVVAPSLGRLRGDFGRVQQVLWNLLSNAIKFTPPGGKIRVQVERVEEGSVQPPGPAIRFTVSDTGIGIAPEYLPHLFERFSQANSSSTREHSGLGLGLAIVRRLVEAHGGLVRAESPGRDQGSTFIVELPASEVRAPEPSPRELEPPRAQLKGARGTLPMLAGRRVLVVDDDADSREALLEALEGFGAKARAASSVREALSVLPSYAPEILVCDLAMPGEDGFALIHQLRGLSPAREGQLPAIALTAYTGNGVEARVWEAGFNSYLAKPVDARLLAETIGRYVLAGAVVAKA